jgi:NitT/TauT family transport system permease protein
MNSFAARHIPAMRWGVIIVSVLLLEAACRTGLITAYTMIPPSQMAVGLYRLLASGSLNGDLKETMSSIVIAACAACLVGLLVALALHAMPRARRSVEPIMTAYYSIPVFVFYPLFIVLFGLNNMPKMIIGFMLGVVAMISSVLNGLDRVPNVLRKVARVNGMSRVATMWYLLLPAATPFIFNGVKLVIAYAFVGVLGAEFIMASSGIGYQISYAFSDFDNVTMYSLVLLVLVVASTVNGLLFNWDKRLRQRRGQ